MQRLSHNRIVAVFLAFFVFVFGSVFPVSGAVGIPKILSYQGRLANSSGTLLGGSSGTTYYFKFSIYDASTGGTRLWPSIDPSSTMSATVTDGVFNIGIGDTTAGGDLLNLDFNSDAYYLNVQVSSDNSSFETLSPRQRIVSSGYAINADSLDGSDTGTGPNDIIKLNSTSQLKIPGGIFATSSAGSVYASSTVQATGNIIGYSLLDMRGAGTSSFSGKVEISGKSLIGGAAICTSSNGLCSAAGAGGWTDDGATVRLTNAADQLSVGSAAPLSPAVLTVHSTSTAATPLLIKGFAGQTARLLSILDSGNASLLTVNSSGNLGIGTSTPGRVLSVEGDAIITGMLKAGLFTSTSTLSVLGSGTSTFSGGISSAGLSSTGGLTITDGMILSNGIINLTTSATSTFTGGIFANDFRTNLPSCDSLDTDSSGAIICGSDATGSGSDGNTITFEVFNNTGIRATTTGKSLFVRGDLTSTSSQALFEVAGDANIHDLLTLGRITATSTATSSFTGGISAGTNGLASSDGLTLTGGVFNSSVIFSNSATASSSFSGGISSAGLSSTGGLTITDGMILSNGILNITAAATSSMTGGLSVSHLSTSDALTISGAGTSTFTGGIFANDFRTNLPSCDSLDTNASGAIVCGTDTDTTYTAGANLTLSGSTFAVKANLYSMGDIFATTTGSSLYASSTVQGASLIGYTSGLFGGTTTPWKSASLAVEQQGTAPSFVVGDLGTTTPLFMIDAKGRIAVGTTTPRAFLSIDKTVASTSPNVAGIEEIFTFNKAGAGTHFGNRMFIINAPTLHSNTLVGSIIKISDSTALANTVRGLEVQAHNGTNTLGENTGIAGFGRTFGVKGITTGDAGGVFEPAGLYGESRGTTQGNALRLYSDTLTSGTLTSLFHETSAFSGTGLLMNLGQGSGGSFTGEFVNLQNRSKDVWSIGKTGSTTIGTTTPYWTLTVAGGVCITAGTRCPVAEINGGLRVDTAGIAGGDDPGDVFDVAERYPASEPMEAGDIAMLDMSTQERAFVTKAKRATSTNMILVGVVSSRPALAINGPDITFAPIGEATSTHPLIALTGRVSVKVTSDNGEIKKGDYITASEIPGVGRKADDGEPSIGIALEDYTTSATTTYERIRKVLVFVNLGHAKLDTEIAYGMASSTASTIDQKTGAFMPLEGSLDLKGKDLVNVRGILSTENIWSIDPEGKLKVLSIEADKIKTRDLEVGSTDKPFGTTIFDTEDGTPYCVYLKAGQLLTVSGTCDQNQHIFSAKGGSASGGDKSEAMAKPPPQPVPVEEKKKEPKEEESLPTEAAPTPEQVPQESESPPVEPEKSAEPEPEEALADKEEAVPMSARVFDASNGAGGTPKPTLESAPRQDVGASDIDNGNVGAETPETPPSADTSEPSDISEQNQQ